MREEQFSVVVPALNEEEHIEKLITSAHAQDFRPIELLIIDDGSTDSTIKIVRSLSDALNSSDFAVVLLETKNFGSFKGPSAARNIGIRNSHGSHILLMDADCVLSQKNILSELACSLRSNSIVGYKDIALIDNWLEYNQMLDEGNPPYATSAKWSHLAFRREILENVPFDPQLGVGEDVDFLQKLRVTGSFNPAMVKVTGHIHFPHTFDEYRLQKFWAGRTQWLFLRKHQDVGSTLSAFSRTIPTVSLILSAVLSLFDVYVGIAFFVFWIIIVVCSFIFSVGKSLSRFTYMVFRFTYGSFWYSIGLLKGYYDLKIRGVINPSRGK